MKDSEITKVRTALHDLQAGLKNLYHENMPAIWIYGSQARGEADSNSDIDVLLLYKNNIQPGEEIQRIGPILADLNLRFQVLISILPAREDQYQNSDSPFWKCIRKEGVPLERI